MSKTTLGLTPLCPAAVPFTAVDLGPSDLALSPCPPLIPWAPSEAGQEPPQPLGLGRHLLPHCPLRRPPLLQSPRLRQVPLSRGAGKISCAASIHTANELPLTTHCYSGLHKHGRGGGGVVNRDVRQGC